MMNLLCLDLGSKTGWAFRTKEGRVFHGVFAPKAGRFEGGGMRYLKFSRWLDEVTGNQWEPGKLFHELKDNRLLVVFEEVRRHQGVDAAHVYGGFLAHLTAWCDERGVPYQGVPVGTIKKHATGKGNASKDEVIAAMRRAGHSDIEDDNEADALAIMGWAIEEHGLGVRPTPKPRKRVQR